MTTIVLYPPEYNMLRKELYYRHEDIWSKVGWFMAYDHVRFVEEMNQLLGCLVLPEMKIDEACKVYLKALESRPRYVPTGKPELKSILLIDHMNTRKDH